VLTFFKENGFGMLGGYINDKIRRWCDRLQDSLVIEAMKKAVEQGKRYWGYVEAILLKWEKRGVKSLEEVAFWDEEFVAGKERKKKQQKTGRTRMEELDEILDRLEPILRNSGVRRVGRGDRSLVPHMITIGRIFWDKGPVPLSYHTK
jgi:DnaD/phage-associated family protein